MVLILNYLPYIIALVGCFVFYKVLKMPTGPKQAKAMIATVLITAFSIIALQGLTNGYIPKARSSEVGIPAPEFEPVAGEIQNNLRSPQLLGEARLERTNRQTDWRQHQRDEERKANQATVPVIEYGDATEADKIEKPEVAP